MIQPRKLPLEKIKTAVSKVFDTTPELIDSDTRYQPHALARQICYYYAMTGRSYVSVAEKFNKHHGSIMHGVKKIRSLCDDDWQIKAYLCEIEKELEAQ
jgi:chromosomal replication initiation ATPase DnaA